MLSRPPPRHLGRLIPAVCHLLSKPDFRSEACEAVRQVSTRRISDSEENKAALVAVFDGARPAAPPPRSSSPALAGLRMASLPPRAAAS